MSILDLKSRLHDLPGIEGLTMTMLNGKQQFGIGGKVIQLDAGASDAAACEAIRASMACDAIVQIPAGTSPPPVGGNAEPHPSAPAGAVHPLAAPATVPPANVMNASAATLASLKANPMSITGAGAAGLSLKAMIEKQRAKIAADLQANLAKIQDGFDKQNEAVAAMGALSDKVHAEAADLMASVGQFTNETGG